MSTNTPASPPPEDACLPREWEWRPWGFEWLHATAELEGGGYVWLDVTANPARGNTLVEVKAKADGRTVALRASGDFSTKEAREWCEAYAARAVSALRELCEEQP